MTRLARNCPVAASLRSGAEDLHEDRSGVDERLREQRAREQPAERACELPPRRGRPRHDQTVMAAQGDEHADERRDTEHDAVRAGRRDPGGDEDDADEQATPGFAPEQDAVGPESRVAREDAAHQVFERVAHEEQDQPDEQERVTVEEVVDEPR